MVHDMDNFFLRHLRRNSAGGLAPKCGRLSNKSRIFYAQVCMRPTITMALWFTYERLLCFTFGAANPSQSFRCYTDIDYGAVNIFYYLLAFNR